MNADSWNELGGLVVNALELPPEERARFLDIACGHDKELRAEIESLLTAYEEAPSYFENLGRGLLPAQEVIAAAPPPNDPYQLIGRDVGPYRIEKKLGSGGMGVVYQGEDTRLRRPVALKFMPPYWREDAQARQRFFYEAQAASALDHPNICTIYEINETPEGLVYIAMACYEGETLHERIARGPLPIEMAIDLGLQMAQGLSRAHAQGIVHRDIKPANVIITDDELVKILDFGLAKLLGGTQLTRAGATLGTVAYMSPEQARGDAIDHRTDIWSLGVVLYEMIAGQRPFLGDYEQAVIYGLLNVDPQPITGLREGVPMQLAHLINKTLKKDLPERYQHVHDLYEDLQAVRQRLTDRSLLEQAVLAPRPSTQDEPAEIAALPGTSRPAPEDEPVKILVVDDEAELELLIRQKFRRQIRSNEWAFSFATNGAEALRILRKDAEIGVVLTDLNMPEMDGLTLLARLAELDRPLRAVVVSAYGDLDNIRTAMNRGAFDFVTKPIDFKDLETTILKTRMELVASKKAEEAFRQVVSMQQELEVARRIQEAILPLSFPEREDVDVYAFATSARDVSGTFYDFFPIGDKRVGVLMGDVAGKGVSAALFMAMSLTFLKGFALQGGAPGNCLTAMNKLLYPKGFPDLSVTVFYGLLDTATGAFTYSSAGHPPPYLLRAGSVVAPLEDSQPAVWIAQDDQFETRSTSLNPGDGLLLYTTGVTGAQDAHGYAFSNDRLAALLRDVNSASPAQIIRNVVRAVMEHTDDTPQTDDLTVLALRYQGP